MKLITVNKNNLNELYNNINGNIYYRFPKINKEYYSLLVDFSEEDILTAMSNGGKFIYVEGPAQLIIGAK